MQIKPTLLNIARMVHFKFIETIWNITAAETFLFVLIQKDYANNEYFWIF